MSFWATKIPFLHFCRPKSTCLDPPLRTSALDQGVSGTRNSFPMKSKKETPKLRGRPQKEDGKRTKVIKARLTETEYQTVLDLEKALGLSRAELLRQRLLDSARKAVVNAAELIGALYAIGTELGRSGNNINQLARYANTLNKRGMLSPVVMERFNILMEGYNREQKELITALRQIIRQLGK